MDKFFELQFEIETSCLLECIHCSSANSHLLAKRQYSDADILRVLELFHGETRVVLTGGEPLLYKNIFELCKNISLKSPLSKIGIYTTGNIANMRSVDMSMANQLKAFQVDECYFTVFHNSAKLHDKWTQKAGSFFNTIDSIASFKKAGISPKVHLVLNRQNINDIENLIHYCERIGIEEVRILRLAPVGRAKANWNDISLPFNIQNNLIEQIIANKNAFSISITVAGYPGIMACRCYPNARGCQAGINLLHIDSAGDIYPCACVTNDSNRFKICHITEIEKLKEMLNSKSEIEYYQECLNSVRV